MKQIAMGRRVCLATEVESTLTKAQNGGWTFLSVAQFYKKVNDRLMYFFPNSGAKTIAERVPRKAIKLHSGHPRGFLMAASVRETVGFVASAEERQSMMRAENFISRTEEEIADKVSDETITENSMEIIILSAVPKVVEIEAIPELAREFASLNKDGKAVVMGVKEFHWKHLGLVSGSSQDTNAILGPPTMVALAGLDSTRSEWDPASAAERLSRWAGVVSQPGVGDLPNYAKLSCGYLAQLASSDGDLVLAGQIAEPDEDGTLIVNASAIAPALDDLARQLARSGLPTTAQSSTLDAAFARMKPYLLPGSALTATPESGISTEGAAETAAKSPDGTEKSAAQQDSKPAAAADSQLAAGPAQPPTVGSEETDTESVTNAHLDLMSRIDAFRIRYPRVAHESAAASRRSPGAGSPGA